VPLKSHDVKLLARQCGFELSGIAIASPSADNTRYLDWVAAGMAASMSYLTDRRAEVRTDPRHLLPSARSIICVGKLYNGPQPYSTEFNQRERAWISRYAWGDDYHIVLRDGLKKLDRLLHHLAGGFDSKICVDTAPLLERSYARDAGLGWIGKNACLINQYAGSWFFLGELITSLDLDPGTPAPDRCGSCTRCIDACPTAAFIPDGSGRYHLDSRLCISYFTIEAREPAPPQLQPNIGTHVFGCDICQDVCPWNRRAAVTLEPAFAPKHFAPPLHRLASITEEQFREMFRHSPVARPRYEGFRRNLAIAIANSTWNAPDRTRQQ
jgi:epoxyqueuosine reductase